MTLGSPAAIVYRKHTFLSAVALGFSAIVIAAIVSGTVILLYGVHLAGAKSERVITLAQGAIRGLPEFTQSLPPALSDMLNDRRQPDYASSLTITTRPASSPGPHRASHTAIEVVNNGKEVVSLLGLRLTTFDSQGRLLSESQEWAATPVATDGSLRGPIMPGSRRYLVSSRYCGREMDPMEDVKTEVEITELRLWNAPQTTPTTAHEPHQEPAASASTPANSCDNG